MAKWILLAVAAGAASGLLNVGVAVGSTGAILLSHVTLLPLFMAGLGIGLAGALLAGATGVLVVGLAAGALAGLIYAVVNAVPVIVLCRQALLSRSNPDGSLEWYPGGLLLAWLIGIATCIYLLVLAYFELFTDGLIPAIRGVLEQYVEALGTGVQPQNVETVLQAAPLVPGIAAAYYVTNTVLNGALAQHLLRRSGRNLRPSIAFSRISLPPQLLYALAASILVGLVSHALGPIAYALAIIVAVAYFLLGLAVVHAFLGARANPGMALFSYYVMLVLVLLLFPKMSMAMVGLGVVEQVLGLRRRFIAGPGKGKE